MKNMLRAISRDGGVVVYAIDSTNIVAEMERLHKTSATVSAALGRSLTAASLMGSMLKNEGDSLTLRIKGDGPVGTILAVSDHLGNVRGICDNKQIDLPLNPVTGKLDVAGVVGRNGTVTVIRDLGLKEPYIGQIPILSGEIAEDITSYFATSEQTPTVCALGVLVNPDLTIKAAGGYILQMLPGATEDEIAMLESNIASMPPISKLIDDGYSIKDAVAQAMDGFEPEILDECEVAYLCRCSDARMRSVLIGLGKKELSEMAESGEEVEIVCSFCNEKYRYSPEQILRMMGEGHPFI